MTAPRTQFGSAYAADAYIGNNYEELQKYFYVMHQRGRNIYSVDQNERDFINAGIRRRMMQNIIGDAAVDGAFLIVGDGSSNDFTITGGNAATGVPLHFYLGGYPVIIETDSTYLTQNTDLNGTLGDTLPVLTTPGGARADEIYLDIYFIDVTSDDDAFLRPDNTFSGLTNRWRLISQVLVAEGSTTPSSPVTDGTGREHHYVKLADLARTGGQDAINALDITDARRTFTYGTIANGGLALTDVGGGRQAALDNISGAVPSVTRHVIVGTDTVQSQLDNAIAGNQFLAGTNDMQLGLDNIVTAPTAANPFITLGDVPVPTAAGTSFDNSGTSLSATDVQGAVEELDARGIGWISPNIRINVGSGNSITIEADTRVLSNDRTHTIETLGTVGIDITVSGQGGLDTGSEASDTWYAVVLIGNSTTSAVDGIFVEESNIGSPTLPGAFDKFAIIGWVRNDGSSNLLPGQQIDQFFRYFEDNELSSGFNTSTFQDVSCSTYVPPNCRMADISVRANYDGANLTRTFYYTVSGASGSVGGIQGLDSKTGGDSFGKTAVFNTISNIPLDSASGRNFAARTTNTIAAINLVGYYVSLV